MSQGIDSVSAGTPVQRSFSASVPGRSTPSPDVGQGELSQKLRQVETRTKLLESITGKGQQVDAMA